jgi:sugar phosphate isomerase/epimerase
MHCNIVTEIRLAREAGYDGLEIVETKLLRYLDQGPKAEDLVPVFEKHGIQPICINALKNVERIEESGRKELMAEAERLCASAKAINCPTIQLVPFCGLQGRCWKEVLELTARNVAEIADIGKSYGMRFQLEPIAWSPIRSLSQSLELFEKIDRDNVGMVIDFWHLWAGEATVPEDVAELDPSLIYGIHFCDGKQIPKDQSWTEFSLRGYLPGDGEIPIHHWVAAVKSTGYDGSWSLELVSPTHWEWDMQELAIECKSRMNKYLY